MDGAFATVAEVEEVQEVQEIQQTPLIHKSEDGNFDLYRMGKVECPRVIISVGNDAEILRGTVNLIGNLCRAEKTENVPYALYIYSNKHKSSKKIGYIGTETLRRFLDSEVYSCFEFAGQLSANEAIIKDRSLLLAMSS